VRLGACCGPPTRCVAWELAHFRAFKFCFGMRTLAVTAACGNGAGHAWRIRTKNENGSKENGSKENDPQERATNAHLEREGRDHEWSLCEERKKTDGAVELGGSGHQF
jgi:hypothetical protein